MGKNIPTGKWSTYNYEVIQTVVEMMAEATLDIKAGWAVETEPELLERMTYEDFLKMLSDADGSEEDAAKFRETLSKALIPLIQQAMIPQQPGQEQ